MRALLRTMAGVLASQGLAHAQPLLDRKVFMAIPPNEALVLDPVGLWECRHIVDASSYTSVVGMQEDGGHPRFAVAEAGKRGSWSRPLAIPFDPQRYPILILTYRATGILGSGAPLILLRADRERPINPITPVTNGDLLANGETQEFVVDLRELDLGAEISQVEVLVHCRGPEPAEFELLGLRFLADNALPPLERTDGPEFPVRVVDSEGKGIEGVTVTVDAERLNWSRSAKTDASGSVKLRAMDNPSGEHMLRVEKKGMVTLDLQKSQWHEGQTWKLPRTVKLPRAVRYGGMVKTEDGKPLAGVSVNMALRHGTPGTMVKWDVAVLTDAAGRWLSPALPAESRFPSVTLRHPEYALAKVENPSVKDMRRQQATLVMHRGVLLKGQVVGPDGRPVADAHLTRDIEGDGMVAGRARTDRDGRFAFATPQLGGTVLTVQAKGFAPVIVPVDQVPGMADVVVRLEPGGTIRGRVVDQDGKPLVGVGMSVEQWRWLHNAISWSGRTDAEGRFAWHEAPADTVQFGFYKNGRMRLSQYPFEVGEEEQTITMPPVLRIRGTVTDAETGKPMRGCTVLPGFVDGPGGFPFYGEPSLAKACPDGQYEVTFGWASPMKTFAIKVTAEGYLPTISRAFWPDEGEQTLDLTLHKGKGIEGVVLLPDGTPAERASVYLVLPGQTLGLTDGLTTGNSEVAFIETEADGRYQFPAGTGKWLLVAGNREGYVEVDAAAHGKSPGLKLQPWAKVEGTHHVGGEPIRGCRVTLGNRLHGGSLDGPEFLYGMHATTDEQGHFVFQRVPPGERSVWGQLVPGPVGLAAASRRKSLTALPGKTTHVTLGGAGRPVIGQLTLPEGTDRKVAWELGTGRLRTTPKVAIPRPEPPAWLKAERRQKRIEVWLRSEDGKAYIAADMRYLEERQQAYASMPTALHISFPLKADGSFRAEDVPAGHYTLHITVNGPVGVGQHQYDRAIGYYRHKFTIPEMAGGRSDKPLDLGPHTVTLR